MWSDAPRVAALLRIQTSSALAAEFDPSPDCAFNFGNFRARLEEGTQMYEWTVSPLSSRTPHHPAGGARFRCLRAFPTQESGMAYEPTVCRKPMAQRF